MKKNEKVEKLIELIKNSKFLVALTGAGVSTLSGIPDFRGRYNPIWDKFPQEKVFDINYFLKEPELFYNFLREILSKKYEVNIVNKVFKILEEKGILKAVITQNIDGLDKIAGVKNVYELHGSIYRNYCIICKSEISYNEFLIKLKKEKVPLCKCGGVIRPDIVFFGEFLPEKALKSSIEIAKKSDLMLIVGTSLVVAPASQIPLYTLNNNGKIIIINKKTTYLHNNAELLFDDIKEVFEEINNYFEK